MSLHIKTAKGKDKKNTWRNLEYTMYRKSLVRFTSILAIWIWTRLFGDTVQLLLFIIEGERLLKNYLIKVS